KGRDGHHYSLPADLVIHIRDPHPADPYGRGIGFGSALADEIDADEMAAKHISSWFHNKGIPAMLVSLLDAQGDTLRRAKREWDNALKGWSKQYSTHWTNAKLEVERLDTSFRELALVDLR